MKILACYSMKGGVGKSASAVNLAYWAAQSGVKTLLIDLDPQGASSFYFRVRSTKKNWGKRFFRAYEDIVKQIKASDYDKLDIIPAHMSYRNFDSLLSSLKKRKNRLKRLVPFFSMVQLQNTLHKNTMETMRQRYPAFLDTYIPFSTDIEKMGEHQAPVDSYARTRPANRAYLALWKELVPILRGKRK